MEARDLDRVLEIERASFGTPWQRQHFEYEIRHAHGSAESPVVRIAEVWVRETQLLGYVCAWLVFGELKINNIAVAPEWRRRGVGRSLLRELLARARSAGCRSASLEVRPSNAAARRLYAAEGFEETGRRAGYYEREGEDAILLELQLGVPPEV